MRVLRSRLIAVFSSCLLTAIFYSVDANSLSYRIKKGDTLTHIARRFFLGPVHSKNGSLRKILDLNAWIKNPNLIRIGKYLNLGTSEGAPKVAQKAEPSRTVASEKSAPAVVEEDKESSVKGVFAISTDFSVSKISARDRGNGATAVVYSKENVGLAFSYSQIWSESFQSYQGLGYRRFNSKPSVDGNGLVRGNQNLWGLNVGGLWSLAKIVRLNLGVGSASRPVLVGFDSSSVTIDPMYVPYMASGVEWDFVHAKKNRAGLGFEYQLSFPIKAKLYDSKLNSAYALKFYLIRNFSRSEVEIGTLATYQQQNTDITTQSMVDYGLYLNIPMTLGDDK